MKLARVYDSIRTAHLERFQVMAHAAIIHKNSRYDYDKSQIPNGMDIRELGRWRTWRALTLESYDAVELNEPMMTGRWLDLTGQILAIRAADFVRRRKTRVTGYCIALTNPAEEISVRFHIPIELALPWTKFVISTLISQYDRLAFGTDGSLRLTEEFVRPDKLRRRSKVIPALPCPCTCASPDPQSADVPSVLFLGAFAEHKGVRQLMSAWESVVKADVGVELLLIGKGALADEVEGWAADLPNVAVRVDPPRADIHAALRRAKVVVLPSQRVGLWREQVGLPIVEGLAHGCEVVTTDETGLSRWLEKHGHQVVRASAGPGALADSILRSMRSRRGKQAVLDALPEIDGRIEADRWLMEDGLGHQDVAWTAKG